MLNFLKFENVFRRIIKLKRLTITQNNRKKITKKQKIKMSSVAEIKAQQKSLAAALKKAEAEEVSRAAAADTDTIIADLKAKFAPIESDIESETEPLFNEMSEMLYQLIRENAGLKASVSTSKTTKSKKGKAVPKYHFTNDFDEDDIIKKKCHKRTVKETNIKGQKTYDFFQCGGVATEKHGYCQRCLDTHKKRMEDHSEYEGTGDMKCLMDGDIRIIGGTPKEITGIVRDDAHASFLDQGVCQGKPITHLVPIPEDIIIKYNLPRPAAAKAKAPASPPAKKATPLADAAAAKKKAEKKAEKKATK